MSLSGSFLTIVCATQVGMIAYNGGNWINWVSLTFMIPQLIVEILKAARK